MSFSISATTVLFSPSFMAFDKSSSYTPGTTSVVAPEHSAQALDLYSTGIPFRTRARKERYVSGLEVDIVSKPRNEGASSWYLEEELERARSFSRARRKTFQEARRASSSFA
jgi:hypothetical protein